MGDPQNILGTANAINIGQKLLMMISKYTWERLMLLTLDKNY